jgi:transcriptional regulator with XRE-family HTH domain
VAEGSPTVRRRELGALLRKLREEKGFSVKDVTDHLLCSPSKVSRIETGQRGATLRDVRDLCDLYGVENARERDRLMTLAREGKEQGWWQSYDLPYSDYVGLEQNAVSIRLYDSAVVPGLFQTSEYAHALHEASIPKQDLEVIDQWVDTRTTRQRILTSEHPPVLHAIMDEAVLHRPVGGAVVMQRQLERVLAVARYQSVSLQIIPYEVGAHPALDSIFTILEFDSDAPGVVYVEGLVGHLFVDHARDLNRYDQVFKRLSDIALGVPESLTLIGKMADAYGRRSLMRQAPAVATN